MKAKLNQKMCHHTDNEKRFVMSLNIRTARYLHVCMKAPLNPNQPTNLKYSVKIGISCCRPMCRNETMYYRLLELL